MGKELLTFLLLFATLTPLATALSCHVCTGSIAESSFAVPGMFQTNPSCVLGNLTNSTSIECPREPGGPEPRCSKTMGVTEIKVAGIAVTMTTTTRSCDVTGSLEEGCKTHQNASAFPTPVPEGTSSEWTICKCYTDQCNAQAPVSAAIVTCISSLVVVMLAVW